MSDALTAPFATAALVLCVAGVAKLRARSGPRWALLAVVELAVGGWCLVTPSRAGAVVMACTYGVLSVAALTLARRRQACGCFGEGEAPATTFQAALSAVLAFTALAAALSTPHGISWTLGRPPGVATVLVLGIAGAAYGTVLAYTELPRAWGSWSVR